MIPQILLEGDAPTLALPTLSGPGERYMLGPVPPANPAAAWEITGELPEGYGTRKLYLTARDPHWLFAFWDLTPEQRHEYNSQSADGHLIVRTFLGSTEGGRLVSETHVHPESRSWFIHAGQGGSRYVAELGYRSKDGRWNSIAASSATMTPPDRQSDDVEAQFATLPAGIKFEEVVAAAREAVAENMPLVEMIEQLRSEGHAELPSLAERETSNEVTASRKAAVAPARDEWTPEQTAALASVMKLDSLRRVWMGSLEITELIRRHLRVDAAAGGLGGMPGVSGPPSSAELGKSSPAGGAGEFHDRGRGFWFNVNAELIIYGATEPDASVTIAERPIKLRPDGSFSFRFALPDGRYELPITAVAADKEESRRVSLNFARSTEFLGDVGTHPQDSELKRPARENVT